MNPIGWWMARSFGLVAYLALWLTVFFGVLTSARGGGGWLHGPTERSRPARTGRSRRYGGGPLEPVRSFVVRESPVPSPPRGPPGRGTNPAGQLG